MWCGNRKVYLVLYIFLSSSVSVLFGEESEIAIAESEDVKFPDEEEPEVELWYPTNNYPPYQTTCTEQPQYKKLADKVKKMLEEFETKFTKMEKEISTLKDDLKTCNTLSTKLEGEVQAIKKAQSSHETKSDEQFEAITKKLQKYFSKLNEAEREVEEMDKTLSNRNKQLVALEEKFETMEDSMKKVKNQVEEIVKRNEEQDKLVEDQTVIIEETKTNITQHMNEQSEKMETELATVKMELEEVSLMAKAAPEMPHINTEPSVVKVEERREIKRIFKLIQYNKALPEISFHVSEPSVRSDWKFYFTLTPRKPCEYSLQYCQYLGMWVKLISATGRPSIAAKFKVSFKDLFDNEKHSQISSLKEFKPKMKFGWLEWISTAQLGNLVDIRESFVVVLELELYPEGTFLYPEDRTNETKTVEWQLPNIQAVSPDCESKNVSTTFTVGRELGTYTLWKVYICYYEDYMKVGVKLEESKWKMAFASWTIDLFNYNYPEDKHVLAHSSTYAKEYSVSSGAIKDSFFISLKRIYDQKRQGDNDYFTIVIDLTLYGKDAKLYRDVTI